MRRKIVLGKTTESGVSIARNKATGGSYVRPTLQVIEGQEISYFKPSDGENCIRILPPTEDQNFWATQTFIHYSVGVDDSGFLCRKKMKIDDETCPICEERAVVASEQEPQTEQESKVLKDLLYDLKPKERWVMQVIDRDEEAKGVQVWNAPVSLVNEILKQTKIPSRLGGGTKPIDDPSLGSDILFHKGKGKGGFVEYSGVQVLDGESIITEGNISEMFYLVDLFVNPSYDEVAIAFGSQSKPSKGLAPVDTASVTQDVDYGVVSDMADVDEEAISDISGRVNNLATTEQQNGIEHQSQKTEVIGNVRRRLRNAPAPDVSVDKEPTRRRVRGV